ncbi:MAG: hypothetical protein P4M15_03355 [Alphaproteobacteria bacterium]|nr:hypothetical protein [Alphaproteobacteria bacterium]
MTPDDLRLFCTALGFTAVVIKGPPQAQDNARQALDFAHLIEAFCLRAANQDVPQGLDEEIERLKSALRNEGSTDLHKDRATLLHLYERLQQRHALYASNDDVADRVLELLDAELDNDDNTAGTSGIS